MKRSVQTISLIFAVLTVFLLASCDPAGKYADIYDAIKHRDLAAVESFIKKSPNLANAPDQKEEKVNETVTLKCSPLAYALVLNTPEIAKYLIENGANVNEKIEGYAKLPNGEFRPRKYEITPLHIACWSGTFQVIDPLVAKGADIFAKDDEGVTSLMYGAYSGNKEVVEKLINHKADLEAKNNLGSTALHWAACYGKKDVAELLINKGSNLNAQDNKGETPLHIAADQGQNEIVQILVARGAKINLRDNRDATPYQLAETRNKKDTAELLKRLGGE